MRRNRWHAILFLLIMAVSLYTGCQGGQEYKSEIKGKLKAHWSQAGKALANRWREWGEKLLPPRPEEENTKTPSPVKEEEVKEEKPVLEGIPKEGKYLVLGDSIAAHYGVAEEDSYYHKLGDLLNQNGGNWEGENWGVSGATTLDLYNTITEALKTPEKRAFLETADLIAISIGGNDLLALLSKNGVGLFDGKEKNWVGAIGAIREDMTRLTEEYKGEITSVVKALKEVNPRATILLQNIYNVAREVGGSITLFGEEYTPSDLVAPLMAPLLKTLEETAKEAGYTVADTYSAFKNSTASPLLRKDFIHPNEEGHTLIAKVLYDTYLGKIGQ